jgi:hypothetical protein
MPPYRSSTVAEPGPVSQAPLAAHRRDQYGPAGELPNIPGVQLHDVLTRFLNASGGIGHVVNDAGAAVDAATPGRATWPATAELPAQLARKPGGAG